MEEQTSFDIDDLFKGVEEDVQTSFGPISVTVYGDRSKTPCVALHDVGLNHRTCFQSLLVASGPQSLMARNFYMLFIDAPGCEPSARSGTRTTNEGMSLEDMASQVTDVLAHFKVHECLGLGVGTGGYLLAKIAAQPKNPFIGLIMISPCCKTAGWWEWTTGMIACMRLKRWGWSKGVRNHVVNRLFAPATTQMLGGDSDLMKSFHRDIQKMNHVAVFQYLRACLNRSDLSDCLKNISCRMLLIFGAQAIYQGECMELATMVDKTKLALVEIDHAGVLVNEERPMDLLSPLQLFLTALQLEGYGLGESLTVGQ